MYVDSNSKLLRDINGEKAYIRVLLRRKVSNEKSILSI